MATPVLVGKEEVGGEEDRGGEGGRREWVYKINTGTSNKKSMGQNWMIIIETNRKFY